MIITRSNKIISVGAYLRRVHNHWKTIQKIGRTLHEQLKGYTISNSFSLSKEAFYLEFVSGDSVVGLKTLLHPKGIFFLYELCKYKPSRDLKQFQEVVGETIEAVITFENERCFLFRLGSGKSLLFKCFGIHANIIYYENEEVKSILRTSLQNDYQFQLSKLNNASVYNQPIIRRNTSYQLIEENGYFHIMHQGSIYASYESAMQAMHEFAKLYLQHVQFDTEKNNLLHHYESLIAKHHQKIGFINQKLQRLNEERPKDEIANIIMANLDKFNASNSADLYDFYNDEMIVVALKHHETAAQRAANLYRKHKHKKIELSYLVRQLQDFENRSQLETTTYEKIKQCDDLKSLVKYKIEKPESQTTVHKFKYFKIDEWEIFAGKSAKNNEELTFGFAGKNDMWLHARGYSGSHVVIRCSSGRAVPQHIIERAAQIAGYFSKGSKSALISVDYTYKKYVTRVKNAPVGTVQMIKYLSIDVEPILPEF